MNSPFNAINQEIGSNTMMKPWFWILLAIVGIMILVSIWNWSRLNISSWFLEKAAINRQLLDIAKSPSEILDSTNETPQLPQRISENWCFVGEDYTGRWCVKVPTSHACDPDRTFSSQSECELVAASNMPLGLLKDGGAKQLPLSAIPAMSNNTVV